MRHMTNIVNRVIKISRLCMGKDNATPLSKRSNELGFFWFLVDAPMYTDDPLIERFHDAVMRPGLIALSESESDLLKKTTEKKLGVGGNGDVDLPFVVNMALKGNFDYRASNGSESTKIRTSSVPRTPERLLEEVVAFYLAHFPQRVLRVDPVRMSVTTAAVETGVGADFAILDATCNDPGPRPLILIDAPRGTKIMPMAGELLNGAVEVLYEELVRKLSTSEEPLKRFSRDMPEDKKAERWGELITRFDSRVAMQIVEEAGKKHGGARFDWIDFRMPWGSTGAPSPFHLHIVPAGRYSMGTFAHAFIQRGGSNGVRIVGTLKTGGDINVMAIYER